VTAADFNGDGASDMAITNSGDNTISVFLSAPVLAMSRANLDFDQVRVGKMSAVKTITLTNAGSATLKISGITTTGDAIQKNNCRKSMVIGASCAIQVAFKPTAPGLRTGMLSILSNSPSSPTRVRVTGVGQ
jgi:hypothetical protein